MLDLTTENSMTNDDTMTRDEMMYVYSDLFKDVWGSRPSQYLVEKAIAMSDIEFQQHWDWMVDKLEAQEEEDRILSEQSMHKLMQSVEALVNEVTSRKDVMRWFADANGDMYEGQYDWDHMLFSQGVRKRSHQRDIVDWAGIWYPKEPAVFCAGDINLDILM